MASHPIYQFYAELSDFKPKIWRRFQVSNHITPARLCYIIQVLFEMEACHLMALEAPLELENVFLRFEIMDEYYEDFLDPDRDVRVFDATGGNLRQIGLKVGSRLNFNYDFGDDWWVMLTLEKILIDKDLPARELPRVLEGAGHGIVEDCGGPGGLANLAKAFRKKKGADYELYSSWLGIEDFDINSFDLDDMNFRLKKIPRIYKQSYEDHLTPTKRSYDLIGRKYLKKSQQ
ncbi:MAG: plasmid pRiA4b ORF-3 family protein [Aminivibrio sp.]|jgi:hypothetical protein